MNGERGERGTVLITAMVFMTILGALVAAALNEGVEKSRSADLSAQVTQGLLLAESAVDAALADIKSGDDGNIGSGQSPVAFAGGGYWAETMDLGEDLAGNQYEKIRGYGKMDSGPASNMVTQVEMIVMKALPGSHQEQPFNWAAYGGSEDTPMTLTGNAETDSFDSGVGAYGGSNTGSNGDMGSNCGLDMDANATISGEVFAAGNYGLQMGGNSVVTEGAHVKDGNATTSANAEITGEGVDDVVSEQTLLSVPDKEADFASDNDNADIGVDSLSIGGNSDYTLPSGRYYFDSLVVNGNGELNIQAPCEIYVKESTVVTGNGVIWVSGADADNRVELYVASGCDIAGNGVVSDGNYSKPTDFLILSHGTDEIKVAGNGSMYASVYAPDAPVKITGNGDIWGSFVGDTVTMTGNAKVHYDEALSNISIDTEPPAGSAGTFPVVVWRQIR